MRFVYLPEDFEAGKKKHITGDRAHHLLNVVRIKKNELIYLLDGQGAEATCQISSLAKNKMEIEVLKVHRHEKPKNFGVALGLCKKEYLESMIKSSVEMGLSSIFFLNFDYSPKLKLEQERIHRIIVSALEQSGNKFYPAVHSSTSIFKFFQEKVAARIFIPSTQEKSKKYLAQNMLENQEKSVLVIGPEGGFSDQEQEYFEHQSNVVTWKAEVPIMRSITALPYFAGQLSLAFASAAKV